MYGKLDKVDDILKQLNLADDSVIKKLLAKGKGGVEQLITTDKGVKTLVITSKKTGKKVTFTNIDIENIRKIESTPAIKKQISQWKKLQLSPLAVSRDLRKKGIPRTTDNVMWEAFRLIDVDLTHLNTQSLTLRDLQAPDQLVSDHYQQHFVG